MTQDFEKMLGELIDRQNVSIMSSVDENGFPNTKALLEPRRREGLKTFYFSTNTSSMRVAQFRNNHKACLYFFDRPSFRGIMLLGTMEVMEDAPTKEMIWRNDDTLYYSQGVTDPDYCVLKFTAFSGRFYSDFSSRTFPIN